MSEPTTTPTPIPQTAEELVVYIKKALEEQAKGFNNVIGTLASKNEALSMINEDLEIRLRLQAERIEILEKQAARPQSFSSISAPSVKLSKPSDFTGEKDSIDAKTWLGQTVLYCTQWPSMSNGQRLSVMLSFMKGAAGRWAGKYIKDLPKGTLTMEKFSEDFESMWIQEDLEGKAVRELETLRQGSTSVPEYVATFKQKAASTHFSNYDQRLNNTFECYRCGEEGHIAWNCKTPPCHVQVKVTSGKSAEEPAVTHTSIQAMFNAFKEEMKKGAF
ncbi:hypothetical protein EDD22DRAFT_987973 [Suillus occidentalis]|nr:hypothetical protein EDD22DRAFT_987973 [Suillus occidentalis]